MYKLIHSPHINSLAESFRDSVNRQMLSVDPLTAVEIIVPNRDTARWLSLFLAEKEGISANLNYKLPSEWLWSRIREGRPELPGLLPCDPDPMAWGIYSLLSDKKILKSFPLLNSYIARQSNSHSLPAWQLAKQISSVFDQYQVYRPDMILEWEKDEKGFESAGWQQKLWNLLNNKWKSLPDPNLRFHRPELFTDLISHYQKGLQNNKSPVYLFNPGLLPPPVDRLLKTISGSSSVFHFIVLSSGSVLLSADGGFRNSLLQCFGDEQRMSALHAAKPSDLGRAHIRVEEAVNPVMKKHNLGRVQAAVLNDRPFPELEFRDRSIEIHSCHSPLREIEVLHQYLIGLFSDHPGLAPDDVLVVMPNIEIYSPFIQAIFGTAEKGLPSIPFHLPGSAGGKSRAGQAFLHLLGIPDSRFKKEDIFDFMQHTAISDRFTLAQSDIQTLKSWFDENRVVWGLDGNHRSEFKQPSEELQTWREAIKRGWLGQLTANEPGHFIDDTLLFTGISTAEEKELWAKLQHIIMMFEEMKKNTVKMKGADEWNSLLNQWIDIFLPHTLSYEKEVQTVRDSVYKSIRAIKTAGFRGNIPYDLIRKSLVEQNNTHSAGGTFFTRGVLFSSMVPVRSLPYKVIALLGLNDDQFPRKPVSPEFDLMAGNILPGERDRKREDRNLFFESIMAAGDIHYCSYIGRNQKDDEKIPPSPILDEWIHILAKSHGIKPSGLVQEHSLNGFSPREFRKGTQNSFSNTYCHLAKAQSAHGKLRGLEVDQPFMIPDEPSQKVIAIKDLEHFFRNPPGYFFRRRLDIYLRDYEKPDEQEFKVDGLNSYVLFQYIFRWVLNGFSAEKMKAYLTQAGWLPEGWPGEWRLNEHIKTVEKAVRQIRENGHEPGFISLDAGLQLDDLNIKVEGEITSCSTSGMLDIHLSDMSGRRLITSWIRHLILCLMHGTQHIKTDLFLDIKKGDGKWYQFDFEPDASSVLEGLLKFYQRGLAEPLNLYIDTGFEYQWHLEKGEEKAMQKALMKWGGDYNPFPESANSYLELIIGRNADPDPEMIRTVSGIIMEPLVRNLRTEK